MSDRDDDRTGPDRDLARLAAATARIDADDRFTAAVLRAATASDPLARLAAATDGLEPDAGFTEAMVRAATASAVPARPAIADGIVRSGRPALVVTALAAAASVLFFLQTQRDVDSAIMASVEALEASE
ncbi:hypothetical protein predicted by Glimmer/Critica [Sorangium cellulosum So ce56]|uniref:Uncharacterized protein n=1 Tax=Sorangium cellulosum (strain So ce56) TaxID=448385 RepID=A9G518_SORC5|nr:hypothetical protein [Sorangium cellulosum]CAN98964.1 hypothetical protein predicted by Glimmer/Critica [Sorangium cellulosum So ce56]